MGTVLFGGALRLLGDEPLWSLCQSEFRLVVLKGGDNYVHRGVQRDAMGG